MTESKTIGRAALIVSLGILLSRVLGLGRNVLLNGVLGLDTGNDLYQAAFTIPDYLFFLMAGGYWSITLVPILTRHIVGGDEAGAQRAFASVFVVVAGAMTVLTIVMIVAARPLTELVFPRLPADELAPLMRIAFGSQIFFVAGTLLMAVQYAHRRFLIPTIAPLVYNLGIIGGGLIGWWTGNPGPEWFLWGGLAGAVVGNFGVQLWGVRKLGLTLFRGASRRHPELGEYLLTALPLMIGQSVVALDENWPRWFGQLGQTGTISGLVAARQLNMLPVGVIAQAAGVAAYPFLAGLMAKGDTENFRTTVDRSVRTALAVSGLAMIGVLVLSQDIVRLAYQRGAFSDADTRVVASFLVIYAVSIPMWGAHQIYTRAFYAMRRMWLPVLVGTAVTAVTVPILWAFGSGGGKAIAWISTLSMLGYTIAITVAWHRAAGGPLPKLRMILNLTAASLAAGGFGWVVAGLVEGESVTASMVRVLAGGTAIVTAFLATSAWFGLEEVTSLVRRKTKRTDRGADLGS